MLLVQILSHLSITSKENNFVQLIGPNVLLLAWAESDVANLEIVVASMAGLARPISRRWVKNMSRKGYQPTGLKWLSPSVSGKF